MNKIVITGITSFIGIHLAKYFSKKNFNVIGTISKDITQYDGIKKDRIVEATNSKVNIEKLDIKQTDEIISIIEKIKPEYWIHHAGWAENYGSYDYDFNKGFEVNVKPLATLYSSLKTQKCKGIIITGSSAEYNDGDRADKETDLTFPMMPYGLSKLLATLYARQLAYINKLPTRVARVYIPFGQLDSPTKLIPSVINNIKNNESINLSTCEQKRDFIYIEDLIMGYEALLTNLNTGLVFDIFNLCSGHSIQLKDLLLMIALQLDTSTDLLKFGSRKMRKGEPFISYGNNQKSIDILHWEPGNLQKGINKLLLNL